MNSLRKYLLNETELTKYLGSVSNYDEKILAKAEADIDKAVAMFYQGAYAKAINTDYVFESTRVTLTTTTATITNLGFSDGFFDYSVIEILDGDDRGVRVPVQTHVGNVLTYFDTTAGLSGNATVRVYQEGKFPMMGDRHVSAGKYFKLIPEHIKEAVAFQYQYRVNEGNNLDTEQKLSGWRRDKDSYSENYDNDEGERTIRQRLSPQALDIIDSYGYTTQSI